MPQNYKARGTQPLNSNRVLLDPGPEILKGQRDVTLTSLAGTMRRRGMSLDAIVAALREENLIKCVPPLPDSQVTKIARSIGRKEPGPLPESDDAKRIVKPADTDDPAATIDALAELPPMEYEKIRKDIAEKLDIRRSFLDDEVKKRRRPEAWEQEDDADLLFEMVEPWEEEVDGKSLFNEIETLLNRHMVLPTYAPLLVALWCFGSYVYDCFPIWPRLLVRSPQKRCGKSTLFEILEAICRRSLNVCNCSAAALYRTIDMYSPTFLVDEADTFLNDNEPLRGVINSSHRKAGACVIRVDKRDDELVPVRYSTWTPIAIAMIGEPNDTIFDRSLVINLERRVPSEKIKRLPLDFSEQCLPIRQRLVRWSQDKQAGLKLPKMPESENDRHVDNFAPLAAIADVTGVGDELRAAYSALNTQDIDDNIRIELLHDFWFIFMIRRLVHDETAVFTETILSYLHEQPNRPWAEWCRGQPMTGSSLARLLKPFGIKAKQIRIGKTNLNGYDSEDFRDVFLRYIDKELPSP